MEETAFHRIADQTLSKIAEAIEEADKGGVVEVDFLNGILNIELKDGKQYIINKHAPTSQIWMSSPFSGAGHFLYGDSKWISSRGGAELLALIREELKQSTGLNVII